MNYKKMIFWYFLPIFIVGFSFSFVLWFVDPLKLFHKPFICENTIYDSARYSVRGLIDTMDFDSVILGTSMLENTSSKEASDKLGGRFINIAMSGSSFYERKIILNYLFQKKQIKNVLYSLDRVYVDVKVDYEFLYDTFVFDDFKIYLNKKYINYIFNTFLNFGEKCAISDFDRPFAWYKKFPQYFGGIKNFAKNKDNSNMANIVQSENIVSYKMFDENILYFAKKHPKTNFILFIPPYSRVQSAVYYEEKVLDIHKSVIKYILEQKLPNIKIYAFDDMDFTTDIANYIDLWHYSEEINSKMLDWIRSNVGLLTLENFDEWWANYEKLVKKFDLEGFKDELQKAMDENQNIESK